MLLRKAFLQWIADPELPTEQLFEMVCRYSLAQGKRVVLESLRTPPQSQTTNKRARSMRANLKDGACGKLRSAVRRASNLADQIALEHDPDYVAEPDTRTAAEKKAAREQRQQKAFEKVYGGPQPGLIDSRPRS